ncbi:hypothetical protein SAMN05216212_2786 [Microbulbifer yueqingensis]|uniref:Uncharacterized protein n=1 Tax=Microbulbifer yueqingensis TaxID=658219 RepID=A0A1G9DFU5_9GAMM|nr:hypothetical protein SAMN05216212_2786 [Microbulbifer yueqingensis]
MKKIKLECPKCFKDSELSVSAGVTCGHCKEDISEYHYKRPLISGATALILGAGGFFAVDKYIIDETRYPLEIEYAIIDSCISGSDLPLRRSSYERKQEICLCSMRETMSDISYDDYKSKPMQFFIQFKQNSASC